MKGICPLADSATPPVCLEVSNSRTVFMSAGVKEAKDPNGKARCYNIEPDTDFEIVVPEVTQDGVSTEATVLEPETPLLYAERSFTGHGAERGGVQTILTNPSPDKEVGFVYMESLPWFMRVYLHTLSARIVDGPAVQGGIIQDIYYRPALDRARGTQLEVKMRIPPKATVFLTYDFEKAILRYTEYPPDANRGFDVAAAVITITSPEVNGDASSIRTTTLLLSLPTPDFSMPYNVIIFTSTAIALAFGGVFNIIVRRFVATDEGPAMGLKAALGKLASRLRRRTAK
jgi:GPI-anchor transamidase subunit T